LHLSRRPETAVRVRAAAEHYGFDPMVKKMVGLYESLILE
jgi:UDP-glucose:(heptosyl)LPS alpha-1,3-glucosyltransferase